MGKYGWLVFFLLLVVFIGLFFWVRGVIFLDPDFGWHLRFGQIALQEGIPYEDRFSYTMPGYPHVNHEWLADVLLSFTYPSLGQLGLVSVDVLLVLLALLVGVSEPGSMAIFKKLRYLEWSLIVSVSLLLASAAIFYYARVRYQSITWLLLATVSRLLFDQKVYKRWRIVLPIIFLWWANLHGGFVLGLCIFAVVVVAFRSLRKRRLESQDLIVLAVSLGSSLVNPYGFRLWGEVWSSVSDQGLRSSVQEWMPAIHFINFALPVWIGFCLVFIVKYCKQIPMERLLLFFTLLVAGLLSQRNIPLLIIFSLPTVVWSLTKTYEEVAKKAVSRLRFLTFMRALLFFSLALFLTQTVLVLRNARLMSEDVFYPKQAVGYLRSNASDGEIFSRYSWGGYLIWKLPGKQVFVDGRMPSWRWDSTSAQVSDSAYAEFTAIMSDEADWLKVFNKYNIDTVLGSVKQVEEDPSVFERVRHQLDAVEIGLGLREVPQNFSDRVSKSGWVEVYKDDTAVILKNPLSIENEER